MLKRLAVLVGGYRLTPVEMTHVRRLSEGKTYLVAVDGGLDAFYKLTILPDLLLGDMDSCSNDAYEWYCEQSGKQLFYPADKDYLDMEAAIDFVSSLGFHEVFLFGVLGGRIDQTFSCLPFLLRGTDLNLSMTIKSEDCQMGILKGPCEREFQTQVHAEWSFLAIEDIQGMTLKGFRFNVENDTLKRTQTMAFSNLSKASKVSISIKKGLMIYFNKPGRQENVEY